MVRLAGSRSEAAAEAADRGRNQRETVRQMGPTLWEGTGTTIDPVSTGNPEEGIV